MSKTIKIVLLPFLCFVITTGLFTSCKKDKDVDTGKVELLSFGPTGAKPGDTLRFIGRNLDKVTTIELTGATVEQSSFLAQTSDLIKIIVPQETQQGYVTLKTPDGDIVSKTQLNLGVTATISSITPQARPGENITISGEYLNWVKRVTFARNVVVDTFVSQSLNELVVKVPAEAQTGPLLIFYAGTDSTEVETKDTLKVTLPAITSFSPNPVKHKTNLTITGTDLDLAKQVLFTGVETPVTSFISQSPTELVVEVPSGTQKGKVTLVAASGVESVSGTDLDVVLPIIATLSPNPIAPGTNLTIKGTNLDLVTSVTFENAPAVTSFVSQTATQLVVKVPMGVLRGKVTLGVLNSTLTVQSADALEIIGDVPPPTIAFPIYNDAVTSNWNGWIGGGWGGTKDLNSTSPVREGYKSIKINYEGGYGSPLQLGGANVNLAPYTTFKISVYGAPGSGGKTISIALNKVNNKYNINVVEGKWTDYAIPLSTLTSSTTLNEIWVQEFSGTGGFTIYADAIGLD